MQKPHRLLLFILGIVMVSLLTTGCGQNYTQSSTQTQTIHTTPQASPPASDPVTLKVLATAYKTGDTISTLLNNGSNQSIYFFDHQTDCTVILLQIQVKGAMKNITHCALGIISVMHTLDAKHQLTVTLPPPHGGWAPGIYRATFHYSTVHSMDAKTLTTIVSAEFSIG